MQAVVERYPEGVLIYFHRNRALHAGIKDVLQQALSGHLTIVTDEQPMAGCYPADIGMQLGDTFHGYSVGEDYIRRHLRNKLGEQEMENLEPALPNFQCGHAPSLGLYHQEGGLLSPIVGSKRVIMVCPSEGELDFLMDKGLNPIHTPNLLRGIKKLAAGDDCPEEDKHLYTGHIDLVLSAVATPEGDNIFIDELLYGFLGENEMLDECLKLSQPIEHHRVRRGACNFKTIETGGRNVALIPTREIVGPIAPALESAKFDIFELGDGQMGAGGIKCRTLEVRWVK